MARLWITLVIVCALGCSRPGFDKEIVGTWESSGVPNSASLPEPLRRSAEWDATLVFADDGTFEWSLDSAAGGVDRWAGEYSVVGYSLEIQLNEHNEKALPKEAQLSYRVRQQATGAIRLPLPQDWTGPSVDYFPKR